MGEQNIGIDRLTVDYCRRLLSAGRLAEGLQGLETLEPGDPDNGSLQHYLGVALHLLGRSKDALEHFDRAHALDPGQAAVYQNHSIALLMVGQSDQALAAAEKSIALKPEAAGGYINLALAQMQLKKSQDAWGTIRKGLEIAPNHPSLLTQASHIAMELQRWSDAEGLVAAALRAAPDSIDAQFNSAMLHQNQGRDQEAIREFDKLLKSQPKHQAAFLNAGVSLRSLGQVEAAIRHFQSGLQAWPDWAVLKYNLAITMLFAGDWQGGWPDYELRSEVAGSLSKSPRPLSPRWNGETISDKTLLVIHEQGFGDTFQFLRMLGFAQRHASRVIFVCPSRLHSLLSRLDMFRKGTLELASDNVPLPAHDVHLPLLSLLNLAKIDAESVPAGIGRIDIEPQRRAKWQSFGAVGGQSPKPWRIGLSWQGNPTVPVDRGRSVPVSELAPLARVSGKVQFISLQRHFGLEKPFPDGMEVLTPGTDFDAGDDAFVDTAALMMTLDLVITSDTALAHLAGMLGRPVWLFLKKVPDWRWGSEGHLSPWYPTMRIFRQQAAGDWQSLFTEAAESLDRLVVAADKQSQVAAARMQEAVDLQTKGRLKEAIEIYRSAMGSRRGDAQFLNFYSMAILEDGKRARQAAQAALPYAMHSLALNPGSGDFWSNLAVLFDGLGSRKDSIRAVRYGLTVNPGHLPSLISLAKKQSAGGDPEKALRTLKDVTASNPKSTQILSALSTIYQDLGQSKEAERAMRRALEVEPENAKLWVQLGAIQSAAEKAAESADSWERAAFYDPQNVDALSNLGVYERNHGELEFSVYLQRRAVERDPLHAEGWNNLGIAELEAARDSVAIAAFRQAIAVRPGYADAHLALGMSLLNGGDFDQGLKNYEWRLKSDKLGISATKPNIPYWAGGDPKGRSIFLMAEQGFGDAFQFSRYAAWLKERGAAKVFIGCRDIIAHLMKTIPGVDDVYGDGAKLPKADGLAFMMSMPALSGMQLATIPAYESYLSADPVRVTKWAEWLAEKPGFRVGIVWQGNPDAKVDKGRSYPLSALEPLAKIPGVRLIALQKGSGEEQIAALGDRFEVERPGPDFDTGSEAFADTAALMMNLDLVVTSDTAVAHLAGALGRPCWVVLKAHPEWRWLSERSDSPWYPATRLFRRFEREIEVTPFAAVMGRIEAALKRLVDGDLSERLVSAPATPGEIATFNPVETFNKALEAQRTGNSKAAEAGFSQVLEFKTLRPAALHMLGVIALHRDKNHRAVVLFREAETVGLASSEFLTNYSIGLRRTGRADDAMSYLRKAIAQKPTAEAYLSLGNILRDECRWDESLASYESAIALKPSLSKAHRGIGNLMRDMHRPEQSLAAFEQARALDPQDPDLVLDHAHAKLFAGDFIGGFKDYEARWGSREMKVRTFDVPRWDGSPIPDKTLMIHGEQGFGDNIQFVRFVEQAAKRAGKVVLEVRAPLMSLFQKLDAGLPIQVIEQGRERPVCDFEVPMISLLSIFGTTVETLPPPARFDIDPEHVAKWRARFPAKGFKVGMIWQGNPKARADQGRSPPLAELAPLFDVPGVEFVSLQKTDGLDQIREMPFASKMIVPGQSLGDFAETAAAILALDLVISSCTATLHLAATLGVPVFGMLKYHADWRWFNERDDSPWYPSLKLFRQKTVFDWQSVVEPMTLALAEYVAAK
ncbi:MAG: repeat protein [Rhizobium sp.]|nr:repeat protein [Rhizobium sp.]